MMFSLMLKTRPFPVSLVHFDVDAKALSSKVKGLSGSGGRCQIQAQPALTDQEKADITDAWMALTEEGEAVKLAKPSNLKGFERIDFLNTKKAAALEKAAQDRSAAEVKLIAGLDLSVAEIDNL